MLDVTNDNHEYKNDHVSSNKSLNKLDKSTSSVDRHNLIPVYDEIESARSSQSFSVNIAINLSDKSQDNNMIVFNNSNLEN